MLQHFWHSISHVTVSLCHSVYVLAIPSLTISSYPFITIYSLSLFLLFNEGTCFPLLYLHLVIWPSLWYLKSYAHISLLPYTLVVFKPFVGPQFILYSANLCHYNILQPFYIPYSTTFITYDIPHPFCIPCSISSPLHNLLISAFWLHISLLYFHLYHFTLYSITPLQISVLWHSFWNLSLTVTKNLTLDFYKS